MRDSYTPAKQRVRGATSEQRRTDSEVVSPLSEFDGLLSLPSESVGAHVIAIIIPLVIQAMLPERVVIPVLYQWQA